MKEYQRAYREANKEKIKETKKAYQKANKEKIKEAKKAYQKANKDTTIKKLSACGNRNGKKKKFFKHLSI